MIEDNIYFIDTPPNIQDEIFYKIAEYLKNYEINDKNVYLKLVAAVNIPDKYFFNAYIGESFNPEANPDFLIFLS